MVMLIKKANDIALKKLVWENPIFIVEKFWLETEKKMKIIMKFFFSCILFIVSIKMFIFSRRWDLFLPCTIYNIDLT